LFRSSDTPTPPAGRTLGGSGFSFSFFISYTQQIQRNTQKQNSRLLPSAGVKPRSGFRDLHAHIGFHFSKLILPDMILYYAVFLIGLRKLI